MRFSIASALLALPLLAAADGPDYQAQFQQYFNQFLGFIPNPSKHDFVGAAEAKLGSMKMDILTVDNWRDTLYGPVKPGSTTPEEWWVLITGGNKTCFGHCGRVEEAFNQTAAKFAILPKGPRTALLNCDNQPVLCNSWSAPPGAVWVFEMLPEPSPITIWTRRFNMTTVTSDDMIKAQKEGIKVSGSLHEGMFHPFNGWIAQNGLSIPAGYLFWGLGLIPSWAFMIIVSMVSRTMMGRRMENMNNRQGPPGAAPAAAPAQ